ncbi:DAK2 domain-containing protein, partial [Microbacterium ulmi]
SGGTSGALWGTGLAEAAAVVGDVDEPTTATVVAAAEAFARGIRERGGARPGEKTMLDAIVPFVDELRSAAVPGRSSLGAWRRAAETADRAAAATAGIVSSRGRSRIHGERSLGTPDAGATSFALVVSRIGNSDHLGEEGT